MSDKIFKQLQKELPNIQKNVLLKNYTTFKIGGPAEYFLIVPTKSRIHDSKAIGIKEKDNLIKAIKIAKNLKLPIFIFGGGSNLLVLDKGIKGLVVKMQDKDKSYFIKNNIVSANSGAELKDLIEFSVENSLEGLEWAGGLPGTFGGAIRGNAGAFGGEIKDIILEVKALDRKFNVKKLSNQQCRFSYRSSIFKKKNWTVIWASLKLKRGDKKSLQEIAKSHIDYRKQRHPLEYPNAGSIFKNIDFKKFSPKLQRTLLPVVKKDPFPVVPTAYLISEAGLKGTRIGDAQVSEKHPNFIVNLGDAKAKDVLSLIDLVREKIKRVYGIDLETEVQIVGF